MAEQILALLKKERMEEVTPYVERITPLLVDGFSWWQRNLLTALTAMQTLMQKLLIVGAAIALRKMVERHRAKFSSSAIAASRTKD